MRRVKIYVRSVVHKEEEKVDYHLALFDSNHNGAIDNLTTVVHPGDTIIWEPDCHSGIRRIIEISPKEDEKNVFQNLPVKRFLCSGFKLKLPNNLKVKKEGEGYSIKYVLKTGDKNTIDPYIRVDPPPVKT
jgi:hypothetical protein